MLGRLIPFFKFYWAALIWAAFIFLLMALPGEDLPDFDFWAVNIEDKIGHVGVFGILAFLLSWGAKRHLNMIDKSVLIKLMMLCISYGALTEFLQGVAFPTRFASFWDFVADSLGAFLGIVFARFAFTNLYRKKS